RPEYSARPSLCNDRIAERNPRIDHDGTIHTDRSIVNVKSSKRIEFRDRVIHIEDHRSGIDVARAVAGYSNRDGRSRARAAWNRWDFVQRKHRSPKHSSVLRVRPDRRRHKQTHDKNTDDLDHGISSRVIFFGG